jgi:poly(ADP-ribose) glycohydrolase ARH3
VTTGVTDLSDRFRGVVVGTAVGDAVGRPAEGRRNPDLVRLLSYVDQAEFLPYTDDTVMTIELAESLLACGGFDGADMARRFALAWKAEPWRGYGSNVPKVFRAVLRGEPWAEAAARQFDGGGSFGNGAAMRVAPVALWAYPDLEETVRLADLTARVTHTHPVGVEGAVIQAVTVHHALREGFHADRVLADLDRLVTTDRFRRKLERLPDCLERNDDVYAKTNLGNWVAADDSVVTALYAFLGASDFEDAVLRAVRLGGDADTIGAMAGAAAGARWGYEAIPWRHKLEGHDRLVALADRLARHVEADPDGD